MLSHSTGLKANPATKADIWSMGCVISVLATWVVLGPSGVRQYTTVRKAGTRKCMSVYPSRNLPPGDLFHDGIGLLPEVVAWHRHLKAVLRRTDRITDKVLGFAELLLKSGPLDRLTAEAAESKLGGILKSCEAPLEQVSGYVDDLRIDFRAFQLPTTRIKTPEATTKVLQPPWGCLSLAVTHSEEMGSSGGQNGMARDVSDRSQQSTPNESDNDSLDWRSKRYDVKWARQRLGLDNDRARSPGRFDRIRLSSLRSRVHSPQRTSFLGQHFKNRNIVS